MDIQEIFQQIMNYAVPTFGGLTVGAILIVIGKSVLTSVCNKLLNKVNVDKAEEEAVKKGIEQIKNISFSQSIEPLVKSELQKVYEQTNSTVEEQLEETQAKYDELIGVLEAFTHYFDNSIGVSEEARENLKNALENAKGEEKPEPQQITVVVEEKQEEKAEEKQAVR